MIIIAFLTFLFFFILAAKRPLLALFSASAVLPAYLLRFTVFGLPSTILEVIIWAVFLGWAASLPRRGRGGEDLFILKIRLQKIKYPLAIFFIASIISIFISPDLFSAVGKWRAFFLESILFFIVFLSVIKNRRDFEKIIFALSISAFYLSIISIGQKFFGLPNPFLENISRAASVFPQPNMLGLYLAPIIILMLGQVIRMKKNLATCYLLFTTALSLLAIVFAQSDGAIIGVLTGLAIFFLLWNKKSRLVFIVSALLLATCYILLPNNSFSFIKEKLLFGDWSGFVRLNIWRETWEMLKDNWLFGAGISGYAAKIVPYHASREWMEIFRYPHNIILNFWSELGLLGLASFLWLLERFGRMCYKLLKPDSGSSLWKSDTRSSPLWKRGVRGDLFIVSAIAAMATIIIHGLVDVPFFKNDLSILFWIIYSIPLIAPSRT